MIGLGSARCRLLAGMLMAVAALTMAGADIAFALPAYEFTPNRWVLASPEATAPVTCVAVSPSFWTDGLVFAGLNDLYGTPPRPLRMSTNRGETWSVVPLPASQTMCIAFSPNFAVDGIMLAGMRVEGDGEYAYRVMKSSNRGLTWAPVTHEATATIQGRMIEDVVFAPDFATSGVAFASCFGAPGASGVLKSTDWGETWTTVGTFTNPGGYVQCLAIAPSWATTQTIFAGTGGLGTFRSDDGGATWTQVLGTDWGWTQDIVVSPDFATDQTLWVATKEGGVARSTDGGATWSQVNTGLAGTSWVEALAVSPRWPLDTLLFCGSLNSSNPIYGGPGGVWASKDLGTTWHQRNESLPANADVEQIEPVRGGWETTPTLFAVIEGDVWARVCTDDIAGPPGVTHLTAVRGSGKVTLGWTNPAITDLASVRVLRSLTGYAAAPAATASQTLIYEGLGVSKVDRELANGKRYYYTAFARDVYGDWSRATTATAVPSGVRPMSKLYLTVTRPRRSHGFYFKGDLTPAHAAKATVTIHVWRRSSGEWTPCPTLTTSVSAGHTTWSKYCKLTRTGSYRAQAWHTDAGHGTVKSPYRYFTVVR